MEFILFCGAGLFLLGLAMGLLWEREKPLEPDYEQIRKDADLRESVERVARNYVHVETPSEVETQECMMVKEDETHPPNPFEETFDGFDEWYFEDFSRIG